MKLDDYLDQLKTALGGKLKSVVLYGSAAAGDFVQKHSDYNLLVVTQALGVPELDQLAGPTPAWTKAGNPPPYCFTMERLKASADVFPIELLDIQEQHRLLFGADLLSDIEVDTAHLRHQVEFELKSKLIQLREHYLLTGGDAKAIQELLLSSLSTFLVLFRAALRLYQPAVPPAKLDALEALGGHLHTPVDVFRSVHSLKAQAAKAPDAKELFQNYLTGIETVVDAVDRKLHNSGS